MIKLSQEEAERYRDGPVVMDIHSGFYIFPVRAPFNLKSLDRTSS
jgi:hypothetical protein